MKFTVEKSTLFKSLSHVQSIVEKKNTIPILSNILIEAKENCLLLSATDMDISIKEKLNCNIIEEGSTTVSAQTCLLYTSPSPRDGLLSRMPSSA